MSLITYLQRNFTTHQAPTTTPRDSAESSIKLDSWTSLAKSSNIQRIHILYNKPNISKNTNKYICVHITQALLTVDNLRLPHKPTKHFNIYSAIIQPGTFKARREKPDSLASRCFSSFRHVAIRDWNASSLM